MTHWYFRPIIEPLGAEHEIFAIDLPGFGESDRPSPSLFGYDAAAFADTVASVMQTLGVARADVIGHSMGGGVAITLAARHPDRVSRIVAAAPALYRVTELAPAVKLTLMPGGERLMQWFMSRRMFARSVRQLSVRDARHIDDDWIDYFWARLARTGGR